LAYFHVGSLLPVIVDEESVGGEDRENEGLELCGRGSISAPVLSDQGWIVRVLHWEREREGHERREGKRGILIRTAVGIIV